MSKFIYSSLTRISNLGDENFSLRFLPKSDWKWGDYIVAEVLPRAGAISNLELANGRVTTVLPGDQVVGALGKRCATLEAVGDWKDISEDLQLQALTAAGVFGKCTSKSSFLPPLMTLVYKGHIFHDGASPNMSHFVRPVASLPFAGPIVLIIGTSMEAGKTITARIIIRLLKSHGLRVGGVKFAGVGRYRDILAMKDAGADEIFDFVDAGLPSTCCSKEEFAGVPEYLLRRCSEKKIDILVAEAGASPLEPYNGEEVARQLGGRVRFTVLCASDPYAVVGLQQAFATPVNLVTGRATCTSAGLDLTRKLSTLPALDIMDPKSLPTLDAILSKTVGGTWGPSWRGEFVPLLPVTEFG